MEGLGGPGFPIIWRRMAGADMGWASWGGVLLGSQRAQEEILAPGSLLGGALRIHLLLRVNKASQLGPQLATFQALASNCLTIWGC